LVVALALDDLSSISITPYDTAIGLDITIGNTTLNTRDDFGFYVTVDNDSPFWGDTISAHSLRFRDTSAAAFSGESLPTTLDLSDFTDSGFGDIAAFEYREQVGNTVVTFIAGQVLSLRPVPEPATAILLAIGLAAMACARTRAGRTSHWNRARPNLKH